MAFKLTKSELQQKQQHVEAVTAAEIVLTTAIERYNEVIGAAKQWTAEIATSRRGEFDGRSERWQTGETGDAASEWVTTWEEFEAEPAEMPDPVVSEALEDLAEEPG